MIHMMNIIKHIHIINLLWVFIKSFFKETKKDHTCIYRKKRQVKIPLGFWFSYSPKQIFINNLDLKHATVINKVMFSTRLTAMLFSTVILWCMVILVTQIFNWFQKYFEINLSWMSWKIHENKSCSPQYLIYSER